MNKKAIFGGMIALALLGVSGAGSAGIVATSATEELLVEREYDANGEVLYETYVEPSNPLLLKTLHYLRASALAGDTSNARPGGGGSDPGTDCEPDNYKTAGWHWTAKYSAQSESYSNIVSGALGEWDSSTAAAISGSVGSGNNGAAGTLDGVNQLEWEFIGSSSTVAVTTTWYYRGSGEAVESDGQYNEYYAWSTSGASDAMDVESVVQHEVGHTFGLNHPNGGGIGCLTMYAYVDYGLTHGRTLGDGDILGIKAVYGN